MGMSGFGWIVGMEGKGFEAWGHGFGCTMKALKGTSVL